MERMARMMPIRLLFTRGSSLRAVNCAIGGAAAYDPGMSVSLRPTTPADLPALFELQRDPPSNEMAGTKPHTREAFDKVWAKIFGEGAPSVRVIVEDGRIVGSINCFKRGEEHHVG